MNDTLKIVLILAGGFAVLYLLAKNKAVAQTAAQTQTVVQQNAVQPSNPLAGTTINNPPVAPATVNAVSQSQGASGVSSSPFSFGPSAAVVPPDISSTDASDPSGQSGGRYQPGHGPALIL